jgi:sulfotransferase family protein
MTSQPISAPADSPSQEPAQLMPSDLHDPADEAMTSRARTRGRAGLRRKRHRIHGGALPNLIVIGAMKCGTTSLHRYLRLHPEISMSAPKELNYFVKDLQWGLGEEWYRSHFDPRLPVRGESSVHYTNFPRFDGVAERIHEFVPEAKLIYVVRDPIERMLSHYVHNRAGGYELLDAEEALSRPSAYIDRSRYFMQLSQYLERFVPERVHIITQEELNAEREQTLRRTFEFLGVDSGFASPEFDRQWETGHGKGRRFSVLDRVARLPGMRVFDKSYDRLPEGMLWMIEKVAYSPRGAPVEKPQISDGLRATLTETFRGDVAQLEQFAGRSFGWSG